MSVSNNSSALGSVPTPDPPQDLGAFRKWVNAPALLRSKRIPRALWEQHRDEICHLYRGQSMRLEDVREIMKRMHGFDASTHQYTLQLAKWGVRKIGAAVQSLESRPSSGQRLNPDSTSGILETHKRSRSEASIRSLPSSASTAQGRRPAKRGKTASSTTPSPESRSTDQDAALTTIDAIQEDTTAAVSVRCEGQATAMQDDLTASSTSTIVAPEQKQPSSVTPMVDLSPDELPPMSKILQILNELCNSELGSPLWDPTIALSPPAATTQSHTICSPSPPPQVTPSQTLPPFLSTALRSIDRNEPVDDLSAQDIADLKRAADYFSIFCYNSEAFELYTVVLKRHISEHTNTSNPSADFCYLVTQCVHNAAKHEHYEIIQNLLLTELGRPGWLQDPRNDVYSFVFFMLLAFVSSRKGFVPAIEDSIHRAKKFNGGHSGFSKLVDQLPCDNRSLDFVLYRNILRANSDKCDLVSPVPFEYRPFNCRLSSEEARITDPILFRVPGPFEITRRDTLGNPCIRSCLLWCSDKLEALIVSESTIEVDDFYIAHLSNEAEGWEEADRFFRRMWEMWCISRRSMWEMGKELWMTETQIRMGISACELLLLICRVIHQATFRISDWNPGQAGNGLYLRLRKASQSLLDDSQYDLAQRFLKQYVARNTVTEWPQWRSSLRKMLKVEDTLRLERALKITFPNLGASRRMVNSMLVNPGETPFDPRIMGPGPKPQLSPTLASSLSSTDLSSFRRTGVRAVHAIRELARGTVLSANSLHRSLRGSERGSRFSTVGMSDVTTSMASMSLGGEGREMGSGRSIDRVSHLDERGGKHLAGPVEDDIGEHNGPAPVNGPKGGDERSPTG